ncbi:MAG: hypothetical protein JWN04_6588 [Myxococcaceae bacterium]|nr:hypothetical protein [Myxococcaceae bacterium]
MTYKTFLSQKEGPRQGPSDAPSTGGEGSRNAFIALPTETAELDVVEVLLAVVTSGKAVALLPSSLRQHGVAYRALLEGFNSSELAERAPEPGQQAVHHKALSSLVEDIAPVANAVEVASSGCGRALKIPAISLEIGENRLVPGPAAADQQVARQEIWLWMSYVHDPIVCTLHASVLRAIPLRLSLPYVRSVLTASEVARRGAFESGVA